MKTSDGDMPADDDVDVGAELEELLLEPDVLDVFPLFALLLHAAPNIRTPSARARITDRSLFNILTDSFRIIVYPFFLNW